MELRLPEILVVPLFQEFAFELLIRFSLLMFQLLSRLYSLFFQLCFLKQKIVSAKGERRRGGGGTAACSFFACSGSFWVFTILIFRACFFVCFTTAMVSFWWDLECTVVGRTNNLFFNLPWHCISPVCLT